MRRSQPTRRGLIGASGAVVRVVVAVAVVLVTVLAAVLAATPVGSGGPGAGPGPAGPVSAPRAAPDDDDPQVLVVSLDGFNPTVLRRLGRRGLPHLWRLFDEGAGTLDARTQVELTDTLPNHTSMVTGRRINRHQGGHGVTWNDDRLRPRTVQRAARHPVASVFTRVHAEGGSTALYAAKTKFRLWERSWPRAIDHVGIHDHDDAAVVDDARADLAAHDRALTFVHLGSADWIGHATGWLSPAYLDAIRRLDRQVGLLLRDADRQPELDDLTLVLTADHGGVPGSTSHGGARRPANYRVPFVVWGPGITHADLYAINPGYRDPGTGQPPLRGKQPIRNGDVADLVLHRLGYAPVPGSLFGRIRPLRVS